jgi:hypothetical protein
VVIQLQPVEIAEALADVEAALLIDTRLASGTMVTVKPLDCNASSDSLPADVAAIVA